MFQHISMNIGHSIFSSIYVFFFLSDDTLLLYEPAGWMLGYSSNFVIHFLLALYLIYVQRLLPTPPINYSIY